MENNKESRRIHRVLAYSYSLYLLLFLCGLILDFIYPLKIFKGTFSTPFGFVLIVIGSALIIWAQRSSLKLDKHNSPSLPERIFFHGPYKFSRSPTHWGLFLMLLGFGMMINSLFVILFTMIAFVVTRLTFVRKQEKILAHKYGIPYLNYKKTVEL